MKPGESYAHVDPSCLKLHPVPRHDTRSSSRESLTCHAISPDVWACYLGCFGFRGGAMCETQSHIMVEAEEKRQADPPGRVTNARRRNFHFPNITEGPGLITTASRSQSGRTNCQNNSKHLIQRYRSESCTLPAPVTSCSINPQRLPHKQRAAHKSVPFVLSDLARGSRSGFALPS